MGDRAIYRVNREVLFVCLFSNMFIFTVSLEKTNSFGMEDLPRRVCLSESGLNAQLFPTFRLSKYAPRLSHFPNI